MGRAPRSAEWLSPDAHSWKTNQSAYLHANENFITVASKSEGEKASAAVKQLTILGSNPNNIPETTVSRRPYIPPQIKSLTSDQARATLIERTLPGDKEAENLLATVLQLETQEEDILNGHHLVGS